MEPLRDNLYSKPATELVAIYNRMVAPEKRIKGKWSYSKRLLIGRIRELGPLPAESSELISARK